MLDSWPCVMYIWNFLVEIVSGIQLLLMIDAWLKDDNYIIHDDAKIKQSLIQSVTQSLSQSVNQSINHD